MKIGGLDLKVAAPSNLDELLLEQTGCSAEEWQGMLRHALTPSHVAKALLPFIKGEVSLSELGRAIVKHGVDDVRATVAKLFADALETLELQQPAPPVEEPEHD